MTRSIALGLLVVAACATGEGPSWEEFERDATRTFEGKTFYVVDGDVAVTHDELRALYDQEVAGTGETTQASTVDTISGHDDLWTAARQFDLRYCISDEFGAQKTHVQLEMYKAAVAWQVEANVRFHYLSTEDASCTGANPNITFAVRPWNLLGACAPYPNRDNCVARTFVINLDNLASDPRYSAAQQGGVFVHELGHLLGLRHENLRVATSCAPETGTFNGVTAYDPDSVMQIPWCTGNPRAGVAITALDALAARRLYQSFSRLRLISSNTSAVSSTVEATPNGAFTAWPSLGPSDLRKLTSERQGDGRLVLLAIGANGRIYERHQTAPGGDWNPEGWAAFGGVNVQQVVTARNPEDRIEAFARFGDGRVYHRWQLAPGGAWNSEGWVALPQPAPGPELPWLDLAVGLRNTGQLDAIAIGHDGHPYEWVQDGPSSAWSFNWTQLGSGDNLAHVAVARDFDRRLFVVALDQSGKPWTNLYAGRWGTFSLIAGHELQQILIGTEIDGRLDLFALGGDRHAYRLPGAPGGGFTSWVDFGGSDLQQLAITNHADGRLDLVARGGDGLAYHRTEDSLGSFPDWTFIGGPPATELIAVAQPY